MDTEKSSFIEKRLSIIIITGLISILILPFLLTHNWEINWLPDFSDKGEIGDTIGGITSPIIGTITILLVYLTYHNQKLELSETKLALNKQNNITQKQQFESTYFNMLKQLDTITEHSYSTFKIQEEQFNERIDKVYSGSYYFKEVVYQIKRGLAGSHQGYLMLHSRGQDFDIPNYIIKLIERFPFENKNWLKNKILDLETFFQSNEEIGDVSILEQDLKDYISIIYKSIFNEHNHNLGHFFRYLNNIIEFINRSDVEDKNFYFNLLQAQMSDPQIALIFYNGISDISNNKEDISLFRTKIDHINLLENLKSDYVSNGYLTKLFYPKTSFKWFSEERLKI